MLLGDNQGRKYTPFVIFKTQRSRDEGTAIENNRFRRGFGVHVWKEIVKLHQSLDIQIYGNTKGWWNRDLSIEFLRFHFSHRKDMTTPILLLWDDFSGHWTPDVEECAKELNVKLMRVPPGTTAVSQPADVAWNSPLKARMRGLWISYLRTQLKAHAEEDKENPFRMCPPDRKVVAKWITQAWELLSASTIANGFKSAGFRYNVGEPKSTEEYDRPSVDAEGFASTLISDLHDMHLIDNNVGEIGSDDDFESSDDTRESSVPDN